uniref:Solute carrier family 5 member 12 n=1 Tax=Gopherus evgoodei TaxID=1825980 RepID=A0A8C4XWB7_9SAUR
MVVMVVGFLTVLIQGTIQNGGPNSIWENASNGSRLAVFDFDVDPLRRHTFWTITIGGTFTWLGIYGVNQSTIQRCISCKSEKQAKLALYLNLVGLWVILVCAVFSGLVMYIHFKNCDPWTAGFISAPDQLMPYFVMDIFSTMPGLPGLFVACAFSGTLSTVAASINALATVTFEDFVKYRFPNLSEKMSTWVSKGLCRYSRWIFYLGVFIIIAQSCIERPRQSRRAPGLLGGSILPGGSRQLQWTCHRCACGGSAGLSAPVDLPQAHLWQVHRSHGTSARDGEMAMHLGRQKHWRQS